MEKDSNFKIDPITKLSNADIFMINAFNINAESIKVRNMIDEIDDKLSKETDLETIKNLNIEKENLLKIRNK